jgi:hypothetical protein
MTMPDLADEIAAMLVKIEANYDREGSGPGSRFAGRTRELVQAEAVLRRLWSLPVTQRLELHGGYPGGVWRCAGCLAELTGSTITHLPRCGEMGLASLIGDGS